jgi:pimeloyl-ACP methyl ester carboxylesterase
MYKSMIRGLRRSAHRGGVALAALTVGLSPAVAQSDSPSPPGRLIDLGGYHLHLNCAGQGAPTVVLSPGAGDFSVDWALVQPEIAKATRVCSYDRGGEAWSDLGPAPRTMDQEVFDLHRLLIEGGEKAPYVLVGHSLGGMVARLFATRYRSETTGLVLVDAFSEDARLFLNGKLSRVRTTAQSRPIPSPRNSVRATDSLGSEDVQKIREFMTQFVGQPKSDPPFDKLPPSAQRERLWALSRPSHYADGDDYFAEITARVYAETNGTVHPMGDLPLIVLQRTRDNYPPEYAAELSREHKEQQQRLAVLSSKGELIIVANAGHHIQLDRPDAVVRAVRSVIHR